MTLFWGIVVVASFVLGTLFYRVSAPCRRKSPWIPVMERLPLEYDLVLVHYSMLGQQDMAAICWWDGKLWWNNANTILDRFYTNVYEWMPLPEGHEP